MTGLLRAEVQSVCSSLSLGGLEGPQKFGGGQSPGVGRGGGISGISEALCLGVGVPLSQGWAMCSMAASKLISGSDKPPHPAPWAGVGLRCF